jgi:hypothetical protein
MKNYFIFLTLAGFVACQDDGAISSNADNPQPITTRGVYDYTTSGSVHNDGVTAMHQNILEWESLGDEDLLEYFLEEITPYVEFEVGYSVESGDGGDVISSVIDDPSLGDLFIERDSIQNRLIRLNALTASEENLLNRMINVYNIDFSSKTSAQIADQVIDSFTVFTSLISNNPTLFTNSEFLATAYVGLGSAQHWYLIATMTGGGVEDEIMPFILAADGIGYLIGWGQAWWRDQGPEYSNSTEAQSKRIGAGMIGAIGTSTLRGLR